VSSKTDKQSQKKKNYHAVFEGERKGQKCFSLLWFIMFSQFLSSRRWKYVCS